MLSKHLPAIDSCTKVYRECTMQANTSGNFSDHAGDLLDSTLNERTREVQGPAMTAISVIIGAAGVVGNLLVVIVFIKYKKLFQNMNTILIINQSVIDGVASFILILNELFTPPPDSLGGSTLFHTKSVFPKGTKSQTSQSE